MKIYARVKPREIDTSRKPIIEIKHLVKHFTADKGFLGRGKTYVHAVDDVSLRFSRGKLLDW